MSTVTLILPVLTYTDRAFLVETGYSGRVQLTSWVPRSQVSYAPCEQTRRPDVTPGGMRADKWEITVPEWLARKSELPGYRPGIDFDAA